MPWNTEPIVTYPTPGAMLQATLNVGVDKLAHCTIGKIETEPYNTYTFDAVLGKWIVHSHNRYTTDAIESLIDFEVPIYTHIINITTGDVIVEDGT